MVIIRRKRLFLEKQLQLKHSYSHLKGWRVIIVDDLQKRQYLPPSLSRKKLWRMYSNDTAVKESYFRKIFNTNFNVGFGKPSTDICSTCVRLKNQAKMEKDEEKKQYFILQLKVHKKRGKSFHQLLNRITDDEVTLVLTVKSQKYPK
ncbi:hypothetical protein ANN_02815 [Periplaneta americana]|uniref:Uncharacterized protein n=1 Tax=Periplaneta americana TaxID=6978 RepID=A0ABQ8TZS9_PERAM|nr:hypothetical protein ANN_02815 [Periplaneta americana]